MRWKSEALISPPPPKVLVLEADAHQPGATSQEESANGEPPAQRAGLFPTTSKRKRWCFCPAMKPNIKEH